MSRKTILLVEDNLDYQELIKIAFDESNFYHNLVMLRDGIEAIDYLFGTGLFENRDLKAMPSLILMDFNMPKLNGLEVLKLLRSSRTTKIIPVVIMSTSIEPEEVINSYSFGCNSYIRKPVDFTDLQIVIQQLALYWLNLNETPPILGALNE
jgi:CheY-like chemotaxis protein